MDRGFAMRITCDLDGLNIFSSFFKLLISITLGLFYLRRFPDKIRLSNSKKGFHTIYYGLEIGKEKSLWYREKMLDDQNRIELDRECEHKPYQVLFTKKRVIHYG